MSISIIAAVGKNGEIGMNGKIPWHIPQDLKHFKDLTFGHSVIMGRKTFESILDSLGKPLPNRKNIVLTRNKNYEVPEGCIVVSSIDEAIQTISENDQVFVIGGAEIYQQAIPYTNEMYITSIDSEFDADTFFPRIDPAEWEIIEANPRQQKEGEAVNFSFIKYRRVKSL